MGTIPTAEEQVEAEAEKQRQLAQARVERREKLGQTAVPEPALGDVVEES